MGSGPRTDAEESMAYEKEHWGPSTKAERYTRVHSGTYSKNLAAIVGSGSIPSGATYKKRYLTKGGTVETTEYCGMRAVKITKANGTVEEYQEKI